MAYFKIIQPNGFISEWKKTDHHDARMALGNTKDGALYFLKEKEVSREAFYNETLSIHEAWLDKKMTTHKQISVCIGASSLPGNWHKVWVKKHD